MKKDAAIIAIIAIVAGAFLTQCAVKTPADGEAAKADTDKGKKAETKAAEAAKKAPAAAKVAAADDLLPVGTSPVKGKADAPVTMVVFSEFQCPFCKRIEPTMAQIEKEYGDKVRVVFKHNPLPFHKDAPLASNASLAAGEQGKFWEYHDKLFENQKNLKRPDLEKYAEELGLDMAKFKTALDTNKFKKQIDADMELAKKVGARGTPNTFVNGVKVTGARPFDAFKTIIDAQLTEADKLKKEGKTADEVYKTLVAKNYEKPAPPRDAPRDDSNDIYKVPVGDSYGKGPEHALVTIVEFSEFQCPFCKRVLPTTQKIHETYGDKVRIVFKHNPLPFHKDAPLASEAALAAGAQGKFWEMHDALFENQRAISRADIEKYAASIGLDVAKFKAELDSGKHKKAIEADQAVANKFGARGTPNFFINGRKLVGAQPFEQFKKVIDEEIEKAQKLVKAGTPISQVYAKLTEKGLDKASAPKPSRGREPDKTVYKVEVSPADAVKGPADALVTIVEFSEFQCPFCSRVLPTMKQVHDKYGNDVRIVFKHNPLPFHKDAPLASEAALAAGSQGKFWEMHDKMFENQKALGRDKLEAYAQEIGLNISKFKGDLDSGKYKSQVKADMDLARSIGAGGTPNFFINGRKLVGAQPFASFQSVIDEELKKAKALVAKGTARGKVYDELTKNGATKPVQLPSRPAEDDSKVYDIKLADQDFGKGKKNAPITVVEFSDFQCPFCSRVNPTMDKIQKTYGDKVRIVFKHNPLSFHKDAPLASQAAIAAGNQGKFWEMHDLLFQNQRAIKRPDLDRYAQEIGLNMEKFKGDLDSGKYKGQVEADIAQARELGATGTPTFFVNGRKLRGAKPFESFKTVIDEELAKLKK